MIEYIAAAALLILAAAGIQRREKCPESHLLSVQESSAVKGILCILVFFNHFSGYFISFGPVFYLFNHTGHMMVAVFFFLSGYGIHNAYRQKTLQAGFLRKRYSKTLLPYWICLAVSVAGNVWFGVPNKEVVNVKNVLLSIVPCKEVVENSWFVGAILFLYLLYYLVRRFGRKMDAAALMCPVMLAFSIWVYPHWAPSFFAFPVGCLIAQQEARVIAFLRMHGVITAALLSAASAAAAVLKIYGQSAGSDTWQFASDTCTILLVPLVVYSVMFFVQPGNPVLRFLGKISYETYLIHGLSIRIAEMLVGKDDRTLFCALALGITILLAFCIHRAGSAVLSVLYKGSIPKKSEIAVQEGTQ